MTYATVHAATSPELTLLRTSGQWAKLRVAFFPPTTVYTARVNQTFSTLDKIIEITYDGGAGTLADAKEGMTMLVGSSAGKHDKGIVRLRKVPTSTKFFPGEESDVKWADNDFLTVINDFDLWARHLTLTGGTPLMDAEIAYSDQHTLFDPVPIMGSHRVLKLVSASISTQYDWSNSWVYGSTISGYSCVAPTASSSSGMTTSTPTITFNTVGWHIITLTVTAANGKTMTGIRYVYVWSEASPPPPAEIGTVSCDVESGGWQFQVTMYANAGVSVIRDRTLAILFSEDHYGTTNQSIGQLAGCENIRAVGRISGENIDWQPEQGKVSFTVHGAQHWFAQMKGFPSGLRMVTDTPASWIDMNSLTVGKALWHFLHWRTTATRVMDVYLTDDTRLMTKVNALGNKLWAQMTEFAFNTILANLGVDHYGRLFCEIDPQMIPAASRSSIPTVMTIEKQDWQEVVTFPRVVVEETGLIDLSGVHVSNTGVGSSFFALSPGGVMKRYGGDDVIDHLSAHDTQAENNQLAGLILGWRANELPQIDIRSIANNPLFDCFPNQYAQIAITENDTPRGIAYSGKLIPRYIALQSGEGGYVNVEMSFEAETFEQNSTNGNIPFSAPDPSNPPAPSFPEIPFPPVLIPGIPESTPDGPPRVLIHDVNKGLIYSENFNAPLSDISWKIVNAGLTLAQYQQINVIIPLPNGGIYVAHRQREGFGTSPFIAYAPSIGSNFTIIEDATSIKAKENGTLAGVIAIGVNPFTNQVAYAIGGDSGSGGTTHFYTGSGTTFAQGIILTTAGVGSIGSLSFGGSNWRLTTALGSTPHFIVLNPAGSSIVRDVSMSSNTIQYHIPVSTTDTVFSLRADGFLKITANGAVAGDFSAVIGSLVNPLDFWDNLTAFDPVGMFLMTSWDSGQRGRSSDGGYTISGIPNLPFGSHYAYAYAGGSGVNSRWIAARGIIRYTPDYGQTWVEKAGDLLGLAPIPNINIVKVI